MVAAQNFGQLAGTAVLAGLCLTLAQLCLALAPVTCLADSVNPPLSVMPQKAKTPLLPQKLSIEDYFPKKSMDYALADPVNLDNARVPGLTPASMKMLSDNLFVIVDNTKFDTMADIYKDNRLRGKSNFVTADAVIHPYLALRNSILAGVIEEHLVRDLSTLLKAMLQSALDDCNKAEDGDVREDIERNMAFLAVAQRLLNPADQSALPDTAKTLFDKEFENIKSGRITPSAIFGVKEDFSQYSAQGWYHSSAKLRNFFRCKQYMSRFTLELAEGKQESSNDPFRRSTLLFRCLEKAQIDGKPALVLWRKINACWILLGPQPYTAEKTLLPSDYSEILNAGSEDLKITLTKLAEPFFRTKLLLSVKKKRPVEVSSTSIFEMAQHKSTQELQEVNFRLFPLVEEAEQSWMPREGHSFTRADPQTPPPPLALLDPHSRGVQQATNILADNVYKVDPNLTLMLPGLVQTMKRQPPAVVPDTWAILASYFKLPVDTAPIALRTNQWMTHKLATGFAAWADAQLALNRPQHTGSATEKPTSTITAHISAGAPASSTTAGGAAASTTPGAPGTSTAGGLAPAASAAGGLARRPVARARFHYLEPCFESYKAMKTAQESLTEKLDAVGYFPKSLREQSTDFLQLLEKLMSIARNELGNKTQMASDSRFLEDIDTVLEKISPPTVGTLFFDSGRENEDEARISTGVTVGLGRPGMVFVIFYSGPGKLFTLSRGAILTQYEVAGGPITAEHWARNLEYGFVKPPFWTDTFEVEQEQPIGGIDASK